MNIAILLVVDEHSTGYQVGHLVGSALVVAIIVLVVVAAIRRRHRRSSAR